MALDQLWYQVRTGEKEYLRICAPMVRYSKLPFRQLVRKYGVDICFSPMIMSDSFSCSSKARDNELTTAQTDQPLVVQFAANQVHQFVQSAQLVQYYCDGVDLNCGCPQRWALQEGIGACLINKPEFVADLVKQTRAQTRNGLSISIKIRIHSEIKQTVGKMETLTTFKMASFGNYTLRKPVKLELLKCKFQRSNWLI